MSQFSLKWNNYINHISYAFESLRSHEDLVDVTLSCEGRQIRAHKILLSACSTYFKDVFKENPCQHPVIIFKNVKYEDLLAIIEFIYRGEVKVQEESLSSFLNTAEMLDVQGLTDTTNTLIVSNNTSTESLPSIKSTIHQSDIKSVSMATQTYPTQTTTSEFTTLKKKRKISHEPVDGNDQQNMDEDVYEECPEAYGDIQQADNVMNDEPDPNHKISMGDQSSEQNKSLTKNKQIEEDNEFYILYQDSDTSERLYTTQESTESIQYLPLSEATVHHQMTSTVCELCHRKFTSNSALKRHQESKHTETSVKYPCQQCVKLFKTKWSLATHTSRFHRNNVLMGKDEIGDDLYDRTEYLRVISPKVTLADVK